MMQRQNKWNQKPSSGRRNDYASVELDAKENNFIQPTPLEHQKTMARNNRLQTLKTEVWKKFRGILPLLVLVLYSLFGGWAFYQLESSTVVSSRIEKVKKLQTAKEKNVGALFDTIDLYNSLNSSVPQEEFERILQQFAEEMGLQPKDLYEWSFLGSLYYAGTLYTTIGYGSIVPVTMGGKALTMAYSVLGIPLLLYNLSQMGKLFCFTIWKVYTFINIYLIHRCGCCPQKQSDLAEFPFSVAICLTIAWTLFCSLLFCIWEDWDFFTSFYFFFQSMTTIGLGDITPHYTSLMVYSFLLIVVGLAMVSMCWNLVQMKLDRLVQKTMKRVENTVVEEEEADMEGDKDPWEKVENLASREGNLLASLLSDSRKRNLVAQWERKARSQNRGVQTELLQESVGTQKGPLVQDGVVQTLFPSQGQSGVPYREIHHRMKTSSSDEFRGLLRELGFILNDCREIIRQEPIPEDRQTVSQ